MKKTMTYASIIFLAGLIVLVFTGFPQVLSGSGQQDSRNGRDYSQDRQGQQNQQGGQGQQGQQARRGNRPPPGPVMIILDINHDGELSAEEIENAVERLKAKDKDGDGKLSREELRPPRPPRNNQQGQQGQGQNNRRQSNY